MHLAVGDQFAYPRGGVPVMKTIIDYLRKNLAVYYLIIFLGMVLPSLLIFTAVERSNTIVAVLMLCLVILANIAVVFPLKNK